jgi:hypothetical protein
MVTTVSAKSVTKLQTFQRQAPADTLFYIDGRVDRRTGSMSLNFNTSFSQWEIFLTEMEPLISNETKPVVNFFRILLKDLIASMGKGNKTLIEEYGLAQDLASAFYMDGMIPVVQLAISEQESLLAAFINAGNESGMQHRTESWGPHQVRFWVLPTNMHLGVDLWLTLAVQDNLASIALLPESLPRSRKLDALGLLPEVRSLADTKTMSILRKQQGFTDYAAGFFSIVEIAKALLQGSSNKTSEDMAILIGATPADALPLDCRDEIVALVDNMPRLVYGFDTIKKQSKTTRVRGHLLLEIVDQHIVSELKTLNGHLPAYANQPGDALVAVGFGLDMAELGSVVNNLRARLINKKFSCRALAELQAEAIAMDPTMLAVAIAMGQGVSGIGAAIYDLDVVNLMEGRFAVDGLVSIATENPNLLAQLASLVPQLEGIVIPTDGSSTSLIVPDMPPGLSLEIAVKGKHLVIFDGNTAAKTAQLMRAEKLNNNGLFAIAANYIKIGDLASQALGQIGNLTESDASSCAEYQSALAALKHNDIQTSVVERFTDAGFQIDFDSRIQVAHYEFKPGNYRLQQLGDGCTWEFSGYEIMAADGTGGYSLFDEAKRCEIYKGEYSWERQGMRLDFNEQSAHYRDGCSDSMETGEPTQYSCIIITLNPDGFDCLFNHGEDQKQVFRYTLEPQS